MIRTGELHACEKGTARTRGGAERGTARQLPCAGVISEVANAVHACGIPNDLARHELAERPENFPQQRLVHHRAAPSQRQEARESPHDWAARPRCGLPCSGSRRRRDRASVAQLACSKERKTLGSPSVPNARHVQCFVLVRIGLCPAAGRRPRLRWANGGSVCHGGRVGENDTEDISRSGLYGKS